MNYNYLRYFSVLAQVEHYSLAAARLGISQPSLSSAIHNLENDLGGVALFEKVGRNVRLTEEGRYFQKKVDGALAELNLASHTLRISRDSAPVVIRLGVISGALAGPLAQTMGRYAAAHPRVRFRVTESNAQELMDMVRQEKLDMAITDSSNRDRSLHFRKLYQQSLYAALPKGHPLAGKECLQPQELLAQDQVLFHYDLVGSFGQWAQEESREVHMVSAANTAQAALELVAAGLGLAALPQSCLESREELVYLPIENWHQALYMCILYDKWLEPLVWEFCEEAVQRLRSSHAGGDPGGIP